MQFRLSTSILFSAVTLLQSLSNIAVNAATTTTTGSISSNIEGSAFAAVFEIFENGRPEIYYYASNLPEGTPQFLSTSVQLTYDSTSQLNGTEYIIAGTVGQGELNFVLTGPGHTQGPVMQATISENFPAVTITTDRHGYWNKFDVDVFNF